jgi:hypothetical protein
MGHEPPFELRPVSPLQDAQSGCAAYADGHASVYSVVRIALTERS